MTVMLSSSSSLSSALAGEPSLRSRTIWSPEWVISTPGSPSPSSTSTTTEAPGATSQSPAHMRARSVLSTASGSPGAGTW